AAVLPLPHQFPDSLRAVHGAFEMHIEHELEVRETHFGESLVPQDSGIVHEYVDAAPAVDGLGNHGFHLPVVSDVCAIRHRLPALIDNLFDNGIGGVARGTRAIACRTQVINNDASAAACELQRMRPAQSVAGAGYDYHPVVEAYCHLCLTFKPR